MSLVGIVGNSLYGGGNEASNLNWQDIVHGRKVLNKELGRSTADEDVGWMNMPLVLNSQPEGG